MNVLFISREKLNNKISPVVQAQADSLKGLLNLSIFQIKGRGWKSYVKSISRLRKYLKLNNVDLIHAHYSYVGMIACLSSRKPVVVSLMGSDIEDYRLGRILIHIFNWLFWKAVIVKSQRSKNKIKLKNASVIPNGVSLDLFKPLPHKEARNKLVFDPKRKYALFLADQERPEKNYLLAKTACELVSQHYDLELLVLHNTAHKEIPNYLSAADVLLLSSIFEGSPNAIKEAMACNCPVVSTDVGDVKELIKDTDGCYITTFEPEDVAEKLLLALQFGKRTNGRNKIQHLDDKNIANKLFALYKSI